MERIALIVNQIKFKTSRLKSSLSDYSDADVLVRDTIAIAGVGDDSATRLADKRGKGLYLRIMHHLLTA